MDSPIQSVLQPNVSSADNYTHIQQLFVVGIMMLLVGLGGGYLLFAPKTPVPPLNSQVVQVIPTNTVPSELPTNDPSPTSVAKTEWKTYTNDKYKFTFQYPSVWTLYDSASRIEVQSSGIGTTVTFYLYGDRDGVGIGNDPARKTITMQVGNENALFREYIATMTKQNSASADVSSLPIAGKYIRSINYYLDNKKADTDLVAVKQILSSFKVNQ